MVFNYENKGDKVEINLIKKLKLPEEIEAGWGITNDSNDNLIITDGSDTIFYVIPDEKFETLKVTKSYKVIL